MRKIKSIASIAFACAIATAACSSENNDTDTATPNDLGAFAAMDTSAYQLAESNAYDYLYDNQEDILFGVEAMVTKQVKIDKLLMAHTKVQQMYKGIPIWGAEAIVHLDSAGQVYNLTDAFVHNIDVDTTPVHDSFAAIDLAVGLHGGWDKVNGVPTSELVIVRQGRNDFLAHKIEINQVKPGQEPAMPVVFIDAKTGIQINAYDNMQTARNRRTYDANNGTSLPGSIVRTEGSGSSGDAVLDEAHANAACTYDSYFNTFGRDSYDDNGATIHSTVHYNSNYVNAFWNGSQMVYGDGDGSQSGPLTVLDVVAHELTHAVTSSESNLIYQNESGALNEGMSDIFAAAVEAYCQGGVDADTWKIGEECWTPATPGDALRYMNDPKAGGDYDYYPKRYTGSSDNGGVHWNSGIANLAFYLLSEGGTHPRGETSNVVTGIGITKAAAIFYRANTVYLTASSNFAAARTATEDACGDLYSASDCDSVGQAWDAVGVGSGGGGPGGDLNSCVDNNACGGQAPGGCACDSLCTWFGDCCPDGPC